MDGLKFVVLFSQDPKIMVFFTVQNQVPRPKCSICWPRFRPRLAKFLVLNSDQSHGHPHARAKRPHSARARLLFHLPSSVFASSYHIHHRSALLHQTTPPAPPQSLNQRSYTRIPFPKTLTFLRIHRGNIVAMAMSKRKIIVA